MDIIRPDAYRIRESLRREYNKTSRQVEKNIRVALLNCALDVFLSWMRRRRDAERISIPVTGSPLPEIAAEPDVIGDTSSL